MSERRFTPGPWKVNPAMPGCTYIFADRNFARVYDEWSDEGNRNANANLIAAAPDLYDALEEALEDLKLWHESQFESYDGQFVTARCEGCATCVTIAKVQATLAKARGEM